LSCNKEGGPFEEPPFAAKPGSARAAPLRKGRGAAEGSDPVSTPVRGGFTVVT
jgi:hypothetical protein